MQLNHKVLTAVRHSLPCIGCLSRSLLSQKYLEYELKPKIQGKPELKCKFFAWCYSSLKSQAQSLNRVTLNSLSIYCTPVPQHISVSFHRFIVLRLQYMGTRERIRDEALAQSLSLF